MNSSSPSQEGSPVLRPSSVPKVELPPEGVYSLRRPHSARERRERRASGAGGPLPASPRFTPSASPATSPKLGPSQPPLPPSSSSRASSSHSLRRAQSEGMYKFFGVGQFRQPGGGDLPPRSNSAAWGHAVGESDSEDAPAAGALLREQQEAFDRKSAAMQSNIDDANREVASLREKLDEVTKRLRYREIESEDLHRSFDKSQAELKKVTVFANKAREDIDMLDEKLRQAAKREAELKERCEAAEIACTDMEEALYEALDAVATGGGGTGGVDVGTSLMDVMTNPGAASGFASGVW